MERAILSVFMPYFNKMLGMRDVLAVRARRAGREERGRGMPRKEQKRPRLTGGSQFVSRRPAPQADAADGSVKGASQARPGEHSVHRLQVAG